MGEDEQRFEALFAAHYPAVLAYVRRRVGPDRAPDVVEDVFLTAWRRLPTVPAAAERAWLYTTARNALGSEFRTRQRQQRLHARVAAQPPAIGADPAEDTVERVRIRAALATLPERDQEVLRLVAWEDLPMADVGRVLGCSAATARVRLHRARRRLAVALGTAEPSTLDPKVHS